MVKKIIDCQNLSKTYRRFGTDVFVALRDVSFTVKEKEVLFICGQNGSGKTTILKLISGFEKADSGNILFFGRDGNVHDRNIRFYDYKWVPQRLDEIISDYVKINELLSISKKERIIELAKKIRANWLLDNVVKKRKAKLVGELSGGQKQLLVGLIALAEKKQILLLDEVFRPLDINIIPRYWDLIKEHVSESNGCAIIVTQDLEFAKEHASHLLILKHGQINGFKLSSEISLKELEALVKDN